MRFSVLDVSMNLDVKICLEMCVELVRIEFSSPCYNHSVPDSCLFGVKSVVYMKQGPMSGIFSVYILEIQIIFY